jgi:hypothetical protein
MEPGEFSVARTGNLTGQVGWVTIGPWNEPLGPVRLNLSPDTSRLSEE